MNREGERCHLHGGRRPKYNAEALLAELDRANHLCRNDQIETKAILEQLIKDLRP